MKHLKWFSMVAIFAFAMLFNTNASAAVSISNTATSMEASETVNNPKKRKIRKYQRNQKRKIAKGSKRSGCPSNAF